MGIISLLTLMGFAVAGMPLMFLTKVAIPFWIGAVALLALTLFLKYVKGMHLSEKMLLMNSGLIIAGIPFQQVEQYNYIFWIIGGVMVVSSIVLFFYNKTNKK